MISRKDILRSSARLRRKKKFDAFSVLLLIFLFIFLALAGLSQMDRFLIKNVRVSGERTLDKDKIGQAVLQTLSGRYFGLFPKNNSFIYGSEKVAEFLKERFLVIKDVAISLDGSRVLNVKIEERYANFIWCENAGGDLCYYADNDGLIFDRAPSFSGGVFFKFEGGMPSGKGPSYYLGKNIMKPEHIRSIGIFKHDSEEIIKKNFSNNWKAVSCVLGEENDIDIFFENDKGKKWKVMIAPRKEEGYSFRGGEAGNVLKAEDELLWAGFDNDLKVSEINFDTILSSKTFKDSAKGVPDPLQNLEYIDLRFGKKIFYKFSS